MINPRFILPLAVLAWLIPAPAARCQVEAPGPAPPADPAMEAMRREALRFAEQREEALRKLGALPEPPVEVRVNGAGRAIMLRLPNQDGLGPPIVLRRKSPEGGQDADEPRYEVAEESFDLALYGSTGDAASAGAYLDRVLDRLIDDVARRRRLSAEHRKKLLLAGRGDIKRLIDRVEDARKTFNALRSDVDRCEEFLSGLMPLSRDLRHGPFDRDSLFTKTLRRIRGDIPTRTPG